jgi:anti-sigma regulatory factor (Ser/Thr protein kinase)
MAKHDSRNDVRLMVRSDPRFLGSIRSLVRAWLEACEVAENVVDTAVLAIDEACANAIRHAYDGRCDETLEVRLHESEDHLEFQVCDQGTPCPPKCMERRPPKRPAANDLKPGGLGVPLMHEIFDEVRFCPGESGGNCVIMRLKKKD